MDEHGTPARQEKYPADGYKGRKGTEPMPNAGSNPASANTKRKISWTPQR